MSLQHMHKLIRRATAPVLIVKKEVEGTHYVLRELAEACRERLVIIVHSVLPPNTVSKYSYTAPSHLSISTYRLLTLLLI